MIKSFMGKTAILAALGAASPLAAQDRLPEPASDSVEVKLTVQAVAAVPAQGYRMQAFLGGRTNTAADAVAILDAVAQVEAREIPDREICFPSYPFGFVGNELIEAAAYAEEAEVEASGEAEASAVPRPYSGLFASREAAEEARRLLRPHSRVLPQVQAVLFDCTAAEESARLATLRKSQTEIEAIARALGMRNAGVSRIESPAEAQSLVIFSALRSAQAPAASDTIEMPAALTMTFRLER
jgi:hypothetical protein